MMTTAQLALLILPWVFIPGMWLVFSAAKRYFAPHRAYLIGFVVYWSVGGVLIPLRLLPAPAFERLFTLPAEPLGNPAALGVASLLLPVLIAPVFTGMTGRLRRLTWGAAVASVLFAVVNGTTEELLWRGVYLTVFADAPLWGYVYPAVAFGLWHIAPQVVEPAAGGPLRFSIAAIFLGLALGWTALQTGSILLPVAAHVLLDIAGLAGLTLLGMEQPQAA